MDYAGKKIGKYFVVSRAEDKVMPSGGKVLQWNCICECGEKEIVTATILRGTKNPMCDKCKEKRLAKEYLGRKFGRLTVIEYAGKDKNSCNIWKCKCECGNIRFAITSSLTSGRVKSCGCLHTEEARKRVKEIADKKGKRDERLSVIWMNMKKRCYDSKNTSFKYYGARGIKVCDEWKESFDEFYKWAISNGYSPNLTIDRIDTNGNYSPKNCRWSTQKVQQNNRRNNHLIEMNGEIHTMAEWCDILNVTKKKIEYYTSRGVSGEDLYKKLNGG